MKSTNILTVLLLAIIPSVDVAESSPVANAKTAPARAGEASIVSLAGKWRFALDRQGVGAERRWFAKDLSDAIELPGNIESQGYGDEITGETKWTTSYIANLYWERLTRYAKYRQPGNVKIPFWWQPERYYTGRSWFQRDIDVPADWRGRRVALMIERVHIQSQVWLDDRPLGMQNGMSVPHRYELGAELTPGKHRVTICVDNSPSIVDGDFGHSIGDHTQGNWNGIAGRIELNASSPVWIDDAQAYPDLAARQTVMKVRLGNATGKPGSGTLRAGSVSEPITWTADGGAAEMAIPFGAKAELWDEFNPKLQHVTVALDAGTSQDERAVTFGLRTIEAGEDLFLINGRKTYLRGTLECCVFPLTGYPPTDVASWKRIISTAQSYGLNLMRFHSWCPPEAAFIAADELGFYLQPEMVWSVILGKGKPLDDWMFREADRILREYGNHPSFILMVPSNEPFGSKSEEFMPKWLAHVKAQDSRRLYSGCVSKPRSPEDAFSIEGNARGAIGWHGGDYRRVLETNAAIKDKGAGKLLGKPILVHEMTQYQAYPNFDEIAKYTGNRKARYLEIFRDDLKANGMFDQARDFLIASGKLQVLCIKEDIEAAMRTRGYSGFELLGLNDFPGQGVSFCGVLDVFWDSKGYVTPEAYRRFCNTTVPLVRLTRETFTSDGTLEAKAEIAHFGKEPLQAAVPEWKVLDASGKQVGGETWSARPIDLGLGTELGTVRLPLRDLPAPGQYRLVLGIKGTAFENDWNFWVYPAVASQAKGRSATGTTTAHKPTGDDPFAATAVTADAGANAVSGDTAPVDLPSGPVTTPSVGVSAPTTLAVPAEEMERSVLISQSLSPRVLEALNKGGSVLLLPSRRREIPPQFPRGEFQPVFWNKSVWGGGGSSETLGLLCDPKHPALSQFPTEFHSDWQWTDLIESSRWLVLDGLPNELRPIVQGIDYQYTNRRLAMVFECRVGPAGGRMLVCSADVQRDLEKRPAARQFRGSLIDYMARDRFQPKVTLTVEQLRPICGRDPLPMPPCTIVADSDGGKEYGAAKAVDGDLSTVWNSTWSKSSVFPHHLTLEFRQPQRFAGLSCVPNTRNNKGWIRQYVVQISDDGQTWTEIAKGEFTQGGAEKVVTLAAPATARFLKFLAISSWDPKSPLAAIAELTLVPAKPSAELQKTGSAENKPLFQERIIFNWHNFLSGCSSWNCEDWQGWTKQAHEMGYNVIMVHAYGNNPMAAYSFQGKERPVGFLTTTAKGRDWGTMHVNDVRRLVGGEVFDGPVFGSDAAMVPDEERVQAARNLMGRVFEDAAKRGMGVYFAVDMDTEQSNPQELIKLLPESARFQNEEGLWLANPETPEGHAFYKAAVSTWMKNYPQITKIAVWARYGDTAWSSLNKALPPAWRKEYEEVVARVPEAKSHRLSPGLFAYSKVVLAVERALKECGATNTQVAIGTWGFGFLPAFDTFLPKHITYFGLDYDSLCGDPQLGSPKRRAMLTAAGAHRPVIPLIWAHHDDGQYFGRPYTPFRDFTAKLKEANAAGFGTFHWMTRPLELFLDAHVRQVFSATKDEPLRATCEWFAAERLREPELSKYLYEWVIKAPMFGRDTTEFFVKTWLTDKDKVVAGCRERLKLLENAKGKNAAYFRGLESFIIAFYEAQTSFQESVTAYRKGDVAAARALICACNPEDAIRQYAAFTSIGGMTRGEKGLLVSLNTRWLVYFYRMRQLLGTSPVRINFGPTSHEKLAGQPGLFTYHFDADKHIWQTLGTKETQAETFTAPSADHEIGRSGLSGNKPFTVEARPLAQRDDLPAGNYRLKLLFVDPESTTEGQRVFKVTAEPIVLNPQWCFETVKAAFLRLKCHGTDKGDWNSLYEVTLPGLLQSESDRVTASGAAEGFPVKNLADGNVETRWAAQGRDHWVQFRLDPNVAINRIGLAWYGADTRNPTFELETSVDGKDWRPVANLKRAGTGSGAEMSIDVFKKAGRANRLVEWEMPVALQQPGMFQITLTPVKGKAIISGLVLEPVGQSK